MNIVLIVILIFLLLLFIESIFYWRKTLSRREEKNKKIMQEFVSLLVHDIRSPLDNIQKISELMLSSKHQLDAKQEEDYTNLIHESAASMLILINTISDAVKLGSGRFVLHPAENNLPQLIEERKGFFALSAKQARISLASALSKEIPSPLFFDRRIIADALNNLIANAIKFNRPSGWVRIDVFLQKKGEAIVEGAKRAGVSLFPPIYREGKESSDDAVVIAISHSDSGIPTETLPHLFRRDEMVDETFLEKNRQAHGSSLFITKNIILRAGGLLGAGSREGEGTTFFFTIPIQR